VQILPDWSDERFPLFAYHPSRHLPPAKVRAFLDFVREVSNAEGAR
jgi:DNA-binding transcriptional LysR family regulator